MRDHFQGIARVWDADLKRYQLPEGVGKFHRGV
jgi:hypothetical protein